MFYSNVEKYKYKLEKIEVTYLDFGPSEPICTEFIKFYPAGRMAISAGYCWDGPSGPAIDTKNFMRGSLIHDALYQLMRMGYLKQGEFKEKSDKALQKICLEDGMSRIRAWWVYLGVSKFGAGSCKLSDIDTVKILEAP